MTKVSSGGRTFALEVPRPTRAAQDQAWHALVSTAGQIGAIVAEIERTAGYRVAVVTLADRDGNRLHGSSPQVQAVRQQIDRIARTDFTVLIEGESGVGKELVARQIHQWSRRNRGPFIAVNCAAIVESLLEAELFGIEDRTATGVRGRRGKLEQANGGSLFLDEVADLSLAAQAKLLRALQEFSVERVGGHQTKKVDIRIMAATNRSLSALVTKGQFRGDLYYRLNALELKVPPLRARREDILDLAQGCLERHAGPGRPCRMSAAALEALLTYEWPGNVRELERVIERAITLAEGDEIQLDDLPPALNERYSIVQPATEGGESMRAWGSRYARLVLERCDNNKRKACRVLDISYHTLQAYLSYTPRLKATQRALPPPATEDVPESVQRGDRRRSVPVPGRVQSSGASRRRPPASRSAITITTEFLEYYQALAMVGRAGAEGGDVPAVIPGRQSPTAAELFGAGFNPTTAQPGGARPACSAAFAAEQSLEQRHARASCASAQPVNTLGALFGLVGPRRRAERRGAGRRHLRRPRRQLRAGTELGSVDRGGRADAGAIRAAVSPWPIRSGIDDRPASAGIWRIGDHASSTSTTRPATRASGPSAGDGRRATLARRARSHARRRAHSRPARRWRAC